MLRYSALPPRSLVHGYHMMLPSPLTLKTYAACYFETVVSTHKIGERGSQRDNLQREAVVLKIQVFWDVTPCRLVYSYRRFGDCSAIIFRDKLPSEDEVIQEDFDLQPPV